MRIMAFFAVIASVVFLLQKTLATYHYSEWMIFNGRYVTLDSSYSYREHNFFERMEILNDAGFNIINEIAMVLLIALTLIIIFLSLFKKVFGKMIFAIVPIAAIVFEVLIMLDGDTNYSLGGVYLYTVNSSTTVNFGLDLIPTIILTVVAVALFITARVFEMKSDKEDTEVPAIRISSLKATPEATVSSDGEDELIKLKKYLDCGIITQEEFDAKRRELLGF